MAEGFLDIVGITYPTSASERESVDIIIHTQNIGADDNLKVELTGDIIDSAEFYLGSGLTQEVPFSFTMPDNNVNITVSTYHWEVPLGGIVIFRQSYFIGDDPSSNDWIAVDTNGDSILEGWGSPSSVGTSMSPAHSSLTWIAIDPEGRNVYYRASNDRVYIYREYTVSHQYWVFDEPEPNAETSSNPVEPYADNGQEVYA